jgi:hypothetical protein
MSMIQVPANAPAIISTGVIVVVAGGLPLGPASTIAQSPVTNPVLMLPLSTGVE